MTDRSRHLTQCYMRECFDYREGRIFWKERPLHHFVDEWRRRIFNSRQSGMEAGTLVHGYRMVKFSWGKVGVHRIIFIMHHGFLPEEIDHITH